MSIYELYERLKEKGYESVWCEDWLRGCDNNVIAFQQILELDRRQVFRIWYSDVKLHARSQHTHAMYHLNRASWAYAYGKIATCIDYILQHP